MVRRDDGREGFVALVDPSKCVSCGICAGSCAPMGVGPPGRTGRDQLAEVRAFIDLAQPSAESVVLVACRHSAGGRRRSDHATPVFPVPCVGALHTSVIEYLVRAGAAGVVVVACPSRDCWNREGVTWFLERAYNQREAELQERVDRRRLHVAYMAESESAKLEDEIARFRASLEALGGGSAEATIDIVALCDVPEVSVTEVEA
jgi:coenzyme F420-reducing hydrogenase delta subunit